MKRVITKANVDELSFVLKRYNDKEYHPINPDAVLLATKAGEVEKPKGWLSGFVERLKGMYVKDGTQDDVDNDGDGADDYDHLVGHLARTYGDLQQAVGITDEDARSAAIKSIIDGHIAEIERLRAGGDIDQDRAADKAGKTISAETEGKLKVIQQALQTAGAAMAELGVAMDAKHDNNDGTQNGAREENQDNLDDKGQPGVKKDPKDGSAEDGKDGIENQSHVDGSSGKKEIDHKEHPLKAAVIDLMAAIPVAEDGGPATHAVSAPDDVLAELEKAKTDKKPYGDVTYADPEDGKYPIDTEAHVRAALSYINMPKNYEKLGDKAAAVKKRIYAAAAKFDIETSKAGEVAEIVLKAEDMKPTIDAAVAKAFESLKGEIDASNARAEAAEKALSDERAATKSKLSEAVAAAKSGMGAGFVPTAEPSGKVVDPANPTGQTQKAQAPSGSSPLESTVLAAIQAGRS